LEQVARWLLGPTSGRSTSNGEIGNEQGTSATKGRSCLVSVIVTSSTQRIPTAEGILRSLERCTDGEQDHEEEERQDELENRRPRSTFLSGGRAQKHIVSKAHKSAAPARRSRGSSQLLTCRMKFLRVSRPRVLKTPALRTPWRVSMAGCKADVRGKKRGTIVSWVSGRHSDAWREIFKRASSRAMVFFWSGLSAG
jgi:hypothetical protein